MSKEFITLGYLKKFTKGILNINKNINDNDDVSISYKEILDGKYYPYFKDSSNPKSIISGLYIEEIPTNLNLSVEKDKLSLIFTKLMALYIKCDSISLSPCGDEIDIITNGSFNIMERTSHGEQVLRKLEYEVNPVLRKDCDEFVIKGHKLSIGENLTNDERNCIITASYAHKNIIKNASIELIQGYNKLSDWIFDYNETKSLEISGDNTIIPRSGGKCVISVKCNYVSHYYKCDSCGNKVMRSEKEGVVDVSRLCQYSLTNTSAFSINNNVISANEQQIGDKKHSCIVIADYDGFDASLIIEQEMGSVPLYEQELIFIDNSRRYSYISPNSKKSEFKLKLKSYEHMVVDGERYSTIVSNDIGFTINDNWIDAIVEGIDSDNNLVVNISLVEDNVDKISDRETELEIYNLKDFNNRIVLFVKQPKNTCFKTEYDILFEGEREFTYDSIKRSKIALKPRQIKHYDDGTTEVIEKLPKGYKIVCTSSSSDDNVLSTNGCIRVDFDGNCELSYQYNDIEVSYNVIATYEYYIVDNKNVIVTDIMYVDIILKHNDIITNEYEFKCNVNEMSFDWHNNDYKTIDIISHSKTYINNEFKGLNDCGFNIKYELTNFIVSCEETEIFVLPRIDNNDFNEIKEKLTIIQDGSDEEIDIILIQNGKPKYQYKDIELTFTIELDNKDEQFENILSVNDYTLNINNDIHEYSFKMDKLWINEFMDNKSDIVFNGIVNLIVGEKYSFNINDLIIVKNNELVPIDFSEEYLIEEDDEGIDLNIKI